MHESYPFPTYSGLLEPKHYKNMGAAIWLFLWCISSTTKEEERDGVTWGVVLGNKPVKVDDLAEQFGVNRSTVKRWIEILEKHDYIRVTRAPYGLIFEVKNSKKFIKNRWLENEPSETRDSSKMSHLNGIDGANLSHLTGGDGSKMSHQGCKNEPSKKDITQINYAADSNANNQAGQLLKVIDAFCALHNKLEFHLLDKDRRLMIQMIGQGIPADFIIQIMHQVHAERSKETRITSFSYYERPIYEAWKTKQAITDGVPVPEGVPLPPVALGSAPITDRVPIPAVALGTPPRRTRLQMELEELRRKKGGGNIGQGSGH